jgi:hypothetical protein
MRRKWSSSDARFRALLARARRTNANRDRIDRSCGAAAPGDCPADILVNTVLDALECGISLKDWDCVAEAYDMLERYRDTLPRTT